VADNKIAHMLDVRRRFARLHLVGISQILFSACERQTDGSFGKIETPHRQANARLPCIAHHGLEMLRVAIDPANVPA